jgi:hypothetical protein
MMQQQGNNADWKDGGLYKTALHGIAGLIEAKVAGGSAAAGIASGVLNEQLTPVMASYLDSQGIHPTNPDGTTNQNFNSLMQLGSSLVGAATGALAGGNTQSAALGQSVAVTAVTNNYLSHDENEARAKATQTCKDTGDAKACGERDALDATDQQRDIAFHAACDGASQSTACTAATSKMQDYLGTYATPEAINAALDPKNRSLTLADTNELQSYVPLLTVSDQTQFNDNTGNPTPSSRVKYNSDPYNEINPNTNGLYDVVKFGNQWLTVGSTDTVSTQYGALNGILNPTDYAPGLMGAHINNRNQNVGIYTLYYTPTQGFVTDVWNTLMDKLGNTTPDAQNFAKVLEGVNHPVTWLGMSRGGVTATEGARVATGDLSNNSMVFDSGANNEPVTNSIFARQNIHLGDRILEGQNKAVIPYMYNSLDPVRNIVGGNTWNPFQIFGSILALPTLVMGPKFSVHTYTPDVVQQSQPEQVAPLYPN